MIKPIETEFNRYGFSFKMMKREGDKAIFRKSKLNIVSYEVVILRRHNGYEINGMQIAPAEYYPSNESWGAHGWSYQDYESALDRFSKVTFL